MLCLMSPESVVPAKHPLRQMKPLADEALATLSRTFDAMYCATGRPSIPPERLLKATLLMALYTVRSERLFCEQLDYNLLFRWFLDMDMTEPSFDHSTFSRNRQRLLDHDVAKEFFGVIVQQARTEGLMSDEHFTVDGTLIEAWASLKSFRPKDEKPGKDDDGKGPPGNPGNRWVNFHGEKRSNETHESKTDPEAKLMRKGPGKEAKLSYSGHALMENRYGLLVDFRVEEANGYAERQAALAMLDETFARHTPPSRSAQTRATTRATSSTRAASATWFPTWPRTPTSGAAQPSTGERPDTPATPSVSACASGSRRYSAGPRPPATSVAPASRARSAHNWRPTSCPRGSPKAAKHDRLKTGQRS